MGETDSHQYGFVFIVATLYHLLFLLKSIT